jgi:hypothetical protein
MWSARGVVALLSLLVWFPAGRAAQSPALQRIDLAERMAAGKLKPVNRTLSKLTGTDGVHVTEAEGPGVVWIEGSDLAEGAIDVDVRGRDVVQRSFVGVAFHRKDDSSYEAVYVRPFNFRIGDPARRQNAVQYMAPPEFDWPVLRQRFPGEFERPVHPGVSPTDWIPLHIGVSNRGVFVSVGFVANNTLTARKLGSTDRGQIGLWVGNNSDGDFRDLRVTPIR